MTLAGLISRFVRSHWAAYAASALMLFGVALLTVWLPRQVGLLVDGLVANRLTPQTLALELAKLVGAGLAIYFLRVGWRLKLYAAAYRLGVELRARLYQRLTLQGPPFFQQRRTGDLMANATNDIDAIELAAGEAMLAGFDGTMTLVLVVAAMAIVVDPKLALVALLPFPPMALAFWWISRHLHDASRDALNAFSHLNDHVQETLSGVRTLRALGLEQRSSARFAELAADAARASERAQRWEATYEPAVGVSLTFAVVLTLGYGGWRVWHGELTIGELTSFNLYLGQLIWPMFAAGWVLSLIERGRAAWGRLQPVLDAPLTLVDEGTETPAPQAPIRLEQVRFAYPGQARPALDGVSLLLPAGHTLGLVGPTGAGKSSVLKLLLRQWDPQSGTLHWGATPLNQLSLQALREQVAWVAQEAFLFSATVAQNIALAKPDATREEVVRAARMASLHEDIERLPQGYDTPVGERGVTLSGGQRQRVAIARALLADRPLLLLDDALSAVDTLTESRILAHLREQRVGRSVIIASHRLSTVMDADHTLVLQHGHVVESGSHAELLARGGWYAAQWQYQQLEQQLEAEEPTAEEDDVVA
ncbi:ABC transporter ATP-binding protein [Rivibacter subsaxonicus]|uniref:ATP-binding cassette subfamily B protein/ATP-binding cassette subfamily C protein/ATP-binding cassette subfamily B multidrug efflux pump n=1 Tax=Rivibacter subsaxonicus TaxID=457575 RepID=A0A4Q7W1D3_9BURK|nr:ABC transporter transmembrane domain-containing protein [Rivibacter subsaxonicus]RZU02940.1 ATP-binding cassette subfamily B protein/ATP-binding cassette subfamily C protein/ATP-binding cassette subfamily B multidrug efflux pump [Rivibacter subsaxonicus]